MKTSGKVSWFGGPADGGVAPGEELAVIHHVSEQPSLFLKSQPPGTSGLARRLDPETFYLAMRWDYDRTPRQALLARAALVRSTKTGKAAVALPADWGPHPGTGRVADISPGLMAALGIETDDIVEIIFPYQGVEPMGEPIKPMVVDLSHWITADDYSAVKKDGIVGVIFKATEGQSYTDPTYVDQQHEAKACGLKWGAYHFADASNTDGQVENFLRFACPDEDELFCLDWEDNPTGNGKMSVSQVKDWINKVEEALDRPGECVIYGGNTIKEAVGDQADPFFAARRLWLCQYGSTPDVPACWDNYWLWQYTDGNYGPEPHSIDGVGHCDINSYQGTPEQLAAEWASGLAEPVPVPEPGVASIHLNIQTTGEVEITIVVNGEVIHGED